MAAPKPSRGLSPAQREAAAELHALYGRGLFPMAEDPRPGRLAEIYWYDPDPRALLPLTPKAGLHVPRRLARTVRQRLYSVSSDQDFDSVVAMCGDPSRPGAWIDEQIRMIATLLHRAGHAHSIEAHDQAGRLVGGLYGVSVPGRAGPVFCAESMVTDFEFGTDAGKVCLVHLLGHLRAMGYSACDVQMANPHTQQFGIVEVSREAYHAMLAPDAATDPCEWHPFDPAKAASSSPSG